MTAITCCCQTREWRTPQGLRVVTTIRCTPRAYPLAHCTDHPEPPPTCCRKEKP